MKKKTTLPLGVISEATLRPMDLLHAFLGALESIRLSKANRALVSDWRRLHNAWVRVGAFDDPSDAQAGSMDALRDELESILNAHCPPYTYFGTLEGDGACFGVFADYEAAVDDVDAGEIRYRDGAEKGYRGLMLDINDHGNVTLLDRQSFGHGYKDVVIWSIV